MSNSIKRIQEAMLILHKEFTALTKQNDLYEEALENINKGLKDLQRGKIPMDKEPAPQNPKKKIHHKKKIPEVKTTGNGAEKKKVDKPLLTNEEKERIKVLDKQGLSGNKIARTINRAQSTVARFIREEVRGASSPPEA